MTVGLE